MLDALKFAFEIMMVGALALLAGTLWYLVATRRAQLSKTG